MCAPRALNPHETFYIAQIPGHTNYARSARQSFSSYTGLRFSREMAVATIGPFTVCNRHEFNVLATLPTHAMYGVTKSSDNLYTHCISYVFSLIL
jgi:hypothetical protein